MRTLHRYVTGEMHRTFSERLIPSHSQVWIVERKEPQNAALGLDDSFANGVADEVRDGTKAQLPHDRCTMGLHGFDADTEGNRHFLIGVSARQQPDDFALAPRQRRGLFFLRAGTQKILQESLSSF